MENNAELKEFLRSRRARLGVEDIGEVGDGGDVGTAGARRVPGLRREEVARLAGVSVDYYSRLEQGRTLNVSDEVLDAVSRALRLDEVERAYLFRIARKDSRRSRRRSPARVQRVRPGVWALLETLDETTPAFVFGRRMDLLAANRLARALLTDFEKLPPRQRNLLRYSFLDESARELFVDWAEVARENVAVLRADAGRHPDDPLLAELVGELAVKSPEFRRWWADHNVRERGHGTKRYHHPVVGRLTLDYECLTLPGDPDQTLCVYTAADEPSRTALRLLANWSAGVAPGPVADAPSGDRQPGTRPTPS